jgi:hypothetical protein
MPSWLTTAWDSVASVVTAPFSFLGDVAIGAIFAATEALAQFAFWAAGLFLQMTGALLDIAIKATISSELYANLEIINVGWTTVRDFSNMFFIFALLYIAIKTILGLGGGSTKKWVANLIIAAVLINFSLFATKVVVDAGNVLAMGFWERMSITVNGTSQPSAALHLMQGLKLQTSMDIKDAAGNAIQTDAAKRTMMYLGGALVMLVAGYVFLAGAIMMIIRTVTLILLMITSPFAFLSFAMPVGGGFASKWFSELVSNAFVAPAFLAMLYLVIRIINSLDLANLTGSDGTKFAGVFSGDIASSPILYNYIMMIIMMLACLKVANAVSSGAGSQAGAMAKVGIGMGAGYFAGSAGVAGRQVGGRVGRLASESRTLQNLANNPNSRMARLAGNIGLRGGKWMQTSTWDARNSSAVNKALGAGGVRMNAGSKKNFETHGGVAVGMATRGLVGGTKMLGDKVLGKERMDAMGKAIPGGATLAKGYQTAFVKDQLGTEREKEIIARANARHGDSPEAMKQMLTDRGVDLSASRNKETTKTLDRKIALKAQEDKAKDDFKAYEAAIKAGKSPDEIKALGTALATSFTSALQGMTGKETGDFLKEEHLNNPAIIKVLGTKELSAVAAKGAELKPSTLSTMTQIIVDEGTPGAKEFLKNQAKVQGPLAYDAKANLTKLTAEYDTKKTELAGDEAAWNTYATGKKKEISSALGMMGGAQAIKELSDEVITHEAVVSQYNAKVVRELKKKIVDTDGANSDLAQKFDAQIKTHNPSIAPKTPPTPHPRDTAAERSAPKGVVIQPTGDDSSLGLA